MLLFWKCALFSWWWWFFVLSPTSRHVYWSKSDNSIVDKYEYHSKQEARSKTKQRATSNAEQQSTKRTKTAAATIATHAHSSVTNFHLHFKPWPTRYQQHLLANNHSSHPIIPYKSTISYTLPSNLMASTMIPTTHPTALTSPTEYHVSDTPKPCTSEQEDPEGAPRNTHFVKESIP